MLSLVVSALPFYQAIGFSLTYRLVGIQVSTVGALVIPLRIVLRSGDERGFAKLAITIIVVGFVLQFVGNILAISNT